MCFLAFCCIFFVFQFCSQVKEIEIHVSANGNDNNTGTLQSPVKSIEKAQILARSLKKQQPEDAVTVFIGEGTYEITSALIFNFEDSGTENAPVTYRAEKGQLPVLTGSKEISGWISLKDQSKLNQLKPEIRSKVYKTNLQALGINDFGDPTTIGKRPDLYCDGKLQTLARWPNNGFAFGGKALGTTELPKTYRKINRYEEGIFEYCDNQQSRWIKEQDIRLSGYWYWDWSDEFQKVEKIDTLKKTLSISPPYHKYGYKDSLRYFGLNLFCEIDQPGEWYLDRKNGELFWYAPVDVDPNKSKVCFSVLDAPYMIEIHDCSNFTIEGLTFTESRGSAILIENGKDCHISECRIERFGQDAIHIENGFGHTIYGCYMSTFGCGGIKLNGGDRQKLIHSNFNIEQNVIEHFSLFKRTYEPAILMNGCGTQIRNNVFRYSSSSAMRMEGNDYLIEYNEISHVVNESDDQGGLDAWFDPSYRGNVIRYNRWSDIHGGTVHGAAGVRLDDMISGVNIYGNIFERCGTRGFGGVQIHGGKDNNVENNVFYQCNAAVSFSTWGTKRWLEYLDSPVIKRKLYEDVDINSALYQDRYPELKDIRNNADFNVIKNNLLIDCKNDFLRKNRPVEEVNNQSIESNGNDPAYFCSSKILKKYGLQPIPYKQIGATKNKWIK